MNLNEQKILIKNLAKKLNAEKVIETHISTILLTKEFAYKIKKPVNFGFLNFSTLKNRKYFCSEEIRLNSRLTKNLYLNFLAIYGSIQTPSFDKIDKVIEYAVKMNRFDEGVELDKIAEESGLSDEIIKDIAIKVANFHKSLPPIKEGDFGKAEVIFKPIKENFRQIREKLKDIDLSEVEEWALSEFDKLKPILEKRKEKGFIKESHGDMHLRNIALIDGEINIFDSIEFNPYFQKIDVISDFAFLLMDLEVRGMSEAANLLLNNYLEITSDYEGLKLLNFYKSYRAMVRAKVSVLSLNDNLSLSEEEKLLSEFNKYFNLAKSYINLQTPSITITYGFSGSGKSFYTSHMLKDGYIRIRSDVERMKLFEPTIRYSKDTTLKIYNHLAKLTKSIIKANFSVIIDATFLQKYQRDIFRELAKELNIKFNILNFECDRDILRERVAKRVKENSDISEANLEVLEKQFLSYEALSEEEKEVSKNIL